MHEEVNWAVLKKRKKNVVVKENKMMDRKQRVAEHDFFKGEHEWVQSKQDNDSAILDIFESQMIINMNCYTCGYP